MYYNNRLKLLFRELFWYNEIKRKLVIKLLIPPLHLNTNASRIILLENTVVIPLQDLPNISKKEQGKLLIRFVGKEGKKDTWFHLTETALILANQKMIAQEIHSYDIRKYLPRYKK